MGWGGGVSITNLTQIQFHSTAVIGKVCLLEADSSAWGKLSKQGGVVTQKRCLVPGGWLHLDPRGL